LCWAREQKMNNQTGHDSADEFTKWARRERGLDRWIGPGVRVAVVDASHGPAIAIVLEEETRVNEIRAAWRDIDKWRCALREWLGPERHAGSDHEFYSRLSRRNQAGAGYGRLANQIEKRILEMLREYARYLDEFETFKPALVAAGHAEGDLLQDGMPCVWWETVKNNPHSFELADSLLRACRPNIGHDDRRELLKACLADVQARAQAAPGTLILGEDIRNRIRYWQEKNPGWDTWEGWRI